MSEYSYSFDDYVTPLNQLPAIIDSVGDYRTRSGKRVTIREIKQNLDLSVSTFSAKGSIWNKIDNIGNNPEYNIWHISGHNMAIGETSRDIIGKW
jgi:hypothetical protein